MKATTLSIDDVEESEEEIKAMRQAQKGLVEPEAETRGEAGTEEGGTEIEDDSDDEAEELEEQESEEV